MPPGPSRAHQLPDASIGNCVAIGFLQGWAATDAKSWAAFGLCNHLWPGVWRVIFPVVCEASDESSRIWHVFVKDGFEGDVSMRVRIRYITSKSWWTCKYHLSLVWSLRTESNELSTCYLALLLSLLTVPLIATLVVTPCWFGACILAAVFERGSWTGIPSKEVGHELSPYNPLDSHPLSLFFELLQVYCEFSHAPMHARGH